MRGRALLDVFAGPLAALARDASGVFDLRVHYTLATASRNKLGSPRSVSSSGSAAASSSQSLLAPDAAGDGDDDDVNEWEVVPDGHADAGASAVSAGWSTAADAADVRKLARRGRPDLAATMRAAVDDARAMAADARTFAPHADVVAMVCGPHALADDLAAAARAVGAAFHAEVFHF